MNKKASSWWSLASRLGYHFDEMENLQLICILFGRVPSFQREEMEILEQ